MVAVDKKFDFELVSPERLLLSEPVDMAVIPGTEGDFGVLAGHTLFISTLRPGIIDVYQGERITNRLFVGGGFAEVTETRCTVLADEAVPVEELQPTQIQTEIDELRQELAGAEREDEIRRLNARLTIAEAKLVAAGRPPAAH